MSAGKLISGRYEIGEVIGDGGMGTVYKGLDTRTKQPVAIKYLKPEVIAQEPGIVERFRREGEALRRLNHPNIVKVLAMSKEEDSYYLVLEYVGGGSLAELMRKSGQLTLKRVLSIALELSDALARAHHLKIVHRDLKPGNVLIASDGTPRLTDFGIAYLAYRSRLTMAQTVMGTLAYLSPEALDGRPMDERADIWSFGVILYEMLTGKLPFDESTPSLLMVSIMQKPIIALENLRIDVPLPLVNLIQRMLEKDPERRVASARLVGAELQAITQGTESVLATVTSTQTATTASDTEEHPLVGLVQALNADLVSLAQKWENAAREAETRGAKPTVDRQTAYFNRGMSKAYASAAAELRSILETTGQGKPPPGKLPQVFAPVTRKEVSDFLEKLGMKVSNLYSDKGYVFTAVFPKLPLVTLDERMDKLRDAAASIVFLNSGKLNETGEPYIDFAFQEPPV
ncbi:MAG: serine/threonine protein kinase [Chloroflexi bacterium]|nr:serine/threonine protein kinase [Chloroflexota bacterium]